MQNIQKICLKIPEKRKKPLYNKGTEKPLFLENGGFSVNNYTLNFLEK